MESQLKEGELAANVVDNERKNDEEKEHMSLGYIHIFQICNLGSCPNHKNLYDEN